VSEEPGLREVKSGTPFVTTHVIPDFAEFILGLAEGKTRGLNPGYAC
jgi:hypothetical protein